jgi:sugar phosphate isomerase/epimerase
MRFGVCGSMIKDSGIDIIEQVREIGYDYIELSLAHLAQMDEAEFAAVRRRVQASGLSCEACNNFFPKAVRLTGSEVDWDLVREYTRRAVGRAAELGAKIIVFGSSVAKNVPAGYPMYRAWQQITRVLNIAADEAGPRGITIAIEPLNRGESNILFSVAEGLAEMQRVKRPEVRVLVDYYHMALEQEDPAILLEAGPNLRHVHFARVAGRTFPTGVDEGFAGFFQALKAAGYNDRVSVEGFSTNFYDDAVKSLAVLRQLVG